MIVQILSGHPATTTSLHHVLLIKIKGFPSKALRESLILVSEKPYFVNQARPPAPVGDFQAGLNFQRGQSLADGVFGKFGDTMNP